MLRTEWCQNVNCVVKGSSTCLSNTVIRSRQQRAFFPAILYLYLSPTISETEETPWWYFQGRLTASPSIHLRGHSSVSRVELAQTLEALCPDCSWLEALAHPEGNLRKYTYKADTWQWECWLRKGIYCASPRIWVDPIGRVVWGRLRPLAYWDWGFESRRRHGCLSVVSVCVVR